MRCHRCTRDRSDSPLLELMQGHRVLGLCVCAPKPQNSYQRVDIKLTLCALGIACEPQCRLVFPTLRARCSGTGPDTLQFLPTPDPTENASSYEGSVLRATALKQLDSLLGLGTAPNGVLPHRLCVRHVGL